MSAGSEARRGLDCLAHTCGLIRRQIGTIEDERSGHAGEPERAGRRVVLVDKPIILDEDQLRRVELAVEPGTVTVQNVGTILLQGMCGLF